MDSSITSIDKEAKTTYPVHDIIRYRWSPRAFSDEPVEKDLLLRIFDAARWAPSSYNEQPWRFIVATKEEPDNYERLAQVLNEYNRKWATTAPVLILTIVKEHFERTGRPNRVAEHDLGAAMSYLTFEATDNDLFVHQMAGILPDKAKELYDIPDGYRPLTMAAIGYLGKPDRLPEDLARKEKGQRTRKPLEELVFTGEWDNPL